MKKRKKNKQRYSKNYFLTLILIICLFSSQYQLKKKNKITKTRSNSLKQENWYKVLDCTVHETGYCGYLSCAQDTTKSTLPLFVKTWEQPHFMAFWHI